MSFDIFEQLADREVPPPPADLQRKVHDRVNDSLLGVHLAEFVLQAVPFALLHFGQAVLGLIGMTLSGDFPHDRAGRPPRR